MIYTPYLAYVFEFVGEPVSIKPIPSLKVLDLFVKMVPCQLHHPGMVSSYGHR